MATNYLKKTFRVLRKLGALGHSKKLNVFGMHPLIISTFFIVLTEVLAGALRRLIKRVTKDTFLRILLLEFVATAELCATCFELIIVADNYGVWTYALYLFLLTLWWSKNWECESACPYSALEEVFEGNYKILQALFLIFAQVLGGLAVFKYINLLWSLELVETHKGRSEEDCTADLQVSMLLGAFIEGVATCLCRVFSKYLVETEARWSTIKDAFFGTMMVVAAFNYSGGYFNPALATALKFGCEGHTVTEHMVVYWLGSIVGSVFAVFLFRSAFVRSYVEGGKVKKD